MGAGMRPENLLDRRYQSAPGYISTSDLVIGLKHQVDLEQTDKTMPKHLVKGVKASAVIIDRATAPARFLWLPEHTTEQLARTDVPSLTMGELMSSQPYEHYIMLVPSTPSLEINEPGYDICRIAAVIYGTYTDGAQALVMVSVNKTGQLAFVPLAHNDRKLDPCRPAYTPDDTDSEAWGRMIKLVVNAHLYLSTLVPDDTPAPQQIKPSRVKHGRTVRPALYAPTYVGASKPSEAAGKGTHASPCAHWRRGHWRRQRTGLGRKHVTMVWIRPVLVGRGQLS